MRSYEQLDTRWPAPIPQSRTQLVAGSVRDALERLLDRLARSSRSTRPPPMPPPRVARRTPAVRGSPAVVAGYAHGAALGRQRWPAVAANASPPRARSPPRLRPPCRRRLRGRGLSTAPRRGRAAGRRARVATGSRARARARAAPAPAPAPPNCGGAGAGQESAALSGVPGRSASTGSCWRRPRRRRRTRASAATASRRRRRLRGRGKRQRRVRARGCRGRPERRSSPRRVDTTVATYGWHPGAGHGGRRRRRAGAAATGAARRPRRRLPAWPTAVSTRSACPSRFDTAQPRRRAR